MACDSKVFRAIQTLMEVFNKYASMDREQAKKKDAAEDQDEITLSKSELKELMEKEMGAEHLKDPVRLEEMMKLLDDDGDGQVDFVEFVSTISNMAYTCFMFQKVLEDANQEK